MFGVIKAMRNVSMKKFFQGKVFGKGGEQLTEETFTQMRRSKYMVKDSSMYFTKMCDLKQKPGFEVMDFNIGVTIHSDRSLKGGRHSMQ